jgi:hypothetical protein
MREGWYLPLGRIAVAQALVRPHDVWAALLQQVGGLDGVGAKRLRRSRYVMNGVNILRCDDYGRLGRRPVLFVPHPTDDCSAWRSLAESMGARRHSVCVIPRGRFPSDWDERGGYSTEDYASDIGAVADDYMLQSPDIVASSRMLHAAESFNARQAGKGGSIVCIHTQAVLAKAPAEDLRRGDASTRIAQGFAIDHPADSESGLYRMLTGGERVLNLDPLACTVEGDFAGITCAAVRAVLWESKGEEINRIELPCASSAECLIAWPGFFLSSSAETAVVVDRALAFDSGS